MMVELEQAFPAAGILGCGFHLNQCIWRKIQGDRPLRELYGNNESVALGMRMFPGLAYVPVVDIRAAFDTLLTFDFVRGNEKVQEEFVNYFERTWIGRERNPPLVKVQWWNQFSAVQGGLSRTNNEIEGWHSAFNARVGVAHPSVLKLVEHLKLQQGRKEFIVANALAQGRDGGSRQTYRDRTKRLEELVASYDRRDRDVSVRTQRSRIV